MKNTNIKSISKATVLFSTIFLLYFTFYLTLNLISAHSERSNSMELMSKELIKTGSGFRSFAKEYKEAEKIFPFLIVENKQIKGLGTAFYYKNDIILTNSHNLLCKNKENCQYFIVYQGGIFEAKYVRDNHRIDIAALELSENLNIKNINICENDVLIGEKVWSFGYGQPFHATGSLKTGYKNTNNQAFPVQELKTNVFNSMIHINIRSGDSGSPLFKKGENCVFGVVNAYSRVHDNLTTYINYNNLIEFLNEVELYLAIKENK